MKFKVDKQKFQKAIHIVEGIISARDIRSIVSNVLIETDEGRIIVTATDLEIGIKTSVEGEILSSGSITIPAKKLSQSVKEFRGTTLSLESTEEDRVVLQDADGKSKARIVLMGTSGEEFPPIGSLPDDQFKSFPTAIAMEMIRKTSYAIAEEDARYVFNGLFLTNTKNQMSFVGTDGRRLAKIDRDFPDSLPFEQGVILPNKAVKELMRLLDSSESGQIALDQKESRVHFRIGSVDLICKLIEGQFPDYTQVIPKQLEYKLEINRDELENSLRQVAVMAAEPTRQVKISFSKEDTIIAASTPDLGEAQDSLSVDYSGEDITIAFNSNYLLDVIRALNVEKITLGISSPNAPAVIMDPDDNHFVAVIMPMKL